MGVCASARQSIDRCSFAYDKCALVRVPAPVLAEVCRGVRYDFAINRLLNNPGIGVAELTRLTAQQAGHMLAKHKLCSARAVDAFVVAMALQFETAVIATGDPKDIDKLSGPFSTIGILAL